LEFRFRRWLWLVLHGTINIHFKNFSDGPAAGIILIAVSRIGGFRVLGQVNRGARGEKSRTLGKDAVKPSDQREQLPGGTVFLKIGLRRGEAPGRPRLATGGETAEPHDKIELIIRNYFLISFSFLTPFFAFFLAFLASFLPLSFLPLSPIAFPSTFPGFCRFPRVLNPSG
jgi:hypothetical protein